MKNGRISVWARSGFFPLIKYVDCLAWIVLFAMMLMTMTDVILRKFTIFSILGSVELTELMMVIVVFCSLAQCELNDGHIKVDLVMNKLSPRIQAVTEVFTQLLCLILFCFMSWAMYRQAVNMKQWGEVTIDLGIPVYPFVYLAFFGCIIMSIVLVYKAISAVYKVFQT